MPNEYFPPEYFPPGYFPEFPPPLGPEETMHARKAIRAAMKSLIVSANTAAADRVYDSRMTPIVKADNSVNVPARLPAVLLFQLGETVERNPAVTIAGLQARTVTIMLKGIVDLSVTQESGMADALDDLAEQIEGAIESDPTLNNTSEAVWLDDTDFSIMERTEEIFGIITLIYSVQYRG